MAADIPCGYNETGFHEIRAPDISQEQIQAVTLSAPSQDQGAPLAGVPRLSEPWLQSKYNSNLVYGHLTEENRTFWLNLDWNSTHPGGPLYKSPKQSIAYLRQKYLKTPVGLPPQYAPLVKTGMLACKVSDAEGNPLACTVMVSGNDRQFPVSIDLSGGFKQKLPAGDYTVTASKSGYNFDTKVVTVLEDLEASVDLTGTRENAPNIQIVTEAVDPVKRCVYYTRDRENHQVFKIKVYLTGPDKPKIKYVKYSLHQTFEKPEHISTDAANNFEMIMWSWGRFVMPITVTTMEGNEYEYMYPFTFRSQLENAQRSGIRFIDATSSWDVIGGY